MQDLHLKHKVIIEHSKFNYGDAQLQCWIPGMLIVIFACLCSYSTSFLHSGNDNNPLKYSILLGTVWCFHKKDWFNKREDRHILFFISPSILGLFIFLGLFGLVQTSSVDDLLFKLYMFRSSLYCFFAKPILNLIFC